MSKLASMLRDEHGISVIELALVLPVIILLVTAVTDIALGYGAKIALQQATARTIEKATAGGLNSAAFQLLQAEGAAAAGVAIDQVAVDKWLECNGVRQLLFDGVCPDGEQVGRYISVTITRTYTPTFSVMNWQSSPNGTWPLTSTSSVRVQ
ncbi:TadE/TadG family type IV pilus assembly protein [Sphingorhabdus sp.]|uniref:TadE/TadG family type IV pilus assembly protein n=1 Tax=Sphingorhabdus sp. TaxID=1902408 RepID=UPI00391A2D12